MVVLIDDEEDFLLSLSKRLNLNGYQTSTYVDSQRAIEEIPRIFQNAKAILIDFSMDTSNEDGKVWEKFVEVKSKESIDTPLFIMTGYDEHHSILEKAKINEIQSIFHKPHFFDDLLESLKNLPN